VSDRGNSTLGPFAIGVAIGAALALLLAPEAGEEFRGELGRGLRSLRDLALEKAGSLGGLLEDMVEEEDDDEPEAAPPHRRIAATSSATRSSRAARTPRKRPARTRRSPADG